MENSALNSEPSLTPHRRVIKRLGGLAATARRLSEVRGKRVPKSTVQEWWESGFIPSRYHDAVLLAGRDIDPPLRASDFFSVDDTTGPAWHQQAVGNTPNAGG